MGRLLAVVALATGCYSPAVDDCEYRCGGTLHADCPAGLTCDPMGYCRTLPITGSSCRPSGGDAAGADAATCGFGTFTPTHFDPCAFSVEQPSWIISGIDTYNTLLGGSAAPTGQNVPQLPPGTTNVRVVRVGTFRVEPQAMFSISGPIPLIIVADNALIEGMVIVDAGINAAACMQAAPGNPSVQGCTSGAAGGGFGGSGGSGGPCAGAAASTATGIAGNDEQSDFHAGCKGGDAGSTAGMIAVGGDGGGALQISATTMITVSSILAAPGRGGSGGVDLVGGGGGGSGGAIFLEAPMINILSMGRVCANGGAGGEGSSMALASSGTCSDSPALSTNNTAGGNGGNGGYASIVNGGDGTMGGPCTNGPCGGGGGGGGVGRIRIRAPMTNITGIVTPVPYQTAN